MLITILHASFYPSVNNNFTFASANVLEHCNGPEMAYAYSLTNHG